MHITLKIKKFKDPESHPPVLKSAKQQKDFQKGMIITLQAKDHIRHRTLEGKNC